MHNIANSVKNVGGTHHFPRKLSKLFGPGYLNAPLSLDPIISYLQPFATSSFRKKCLNTFFDNIDEATYLLQEQVIELQQRSILLEKQVMDHAQMFVSHQVQIQREHQFNLELTNTIREFASRFDGALYVLF